MSTFNLKLYNIIRVLINQVSVLFMIACIISCNKNTNGSSSNGSSTGSNSNTTVDTTGPLKTAATFPYFGFAIDYTLMNTDGNYSAIVKAQANSVTFGYEMKHGAIVQNDGSLDYTKADELFNLCTAAGLQVYGHTLAWHQNQNANYLKSLTVGGAATGAPNLFSNGDFESGVGTSGTGSTLFTGWNCLIGGTSAGSFAAVSGNNSSRVMQVTVTTPGANAYDIQAIGSAWSANVGDIYKVSVDIKSSVTTGKIRMVMQNSLYQQDDITPTTSWATYSWTLTEGESAPIFRLNFPAAGTYTIDNITIVDLTTAPAPTASQIASSVDTALSTFIRNTVTRYAGKTKAWDVVNESMADGNSGLRTSSNTTVTSGATDYFFWSDYLGRNYALKAFQYAKAADGAALLFINEYNLESNNTKLDSLIAFINELKSKGAQIDGVGTQMHISINTLYTGIDNAFKKLAATGLKVRVSELDVRVNPGNDPNFVETTSILSTQSDMYKYVIKSYLANVPAGQQYGITIWGVSDADSWINTSQHQLDFPLLFNGVTYSKKSAYTGVLLGLKGQ